MKARSPAWIIVAGAVVVQASGVLGVVGNAITGIDSAIRATIDLKGLFTKAVIAPIQQIQPVVIPPTAKLKKAAQAMPKKAQ